MRFYNLTLERATGINLAVSGDFIGDGTQQVVASSGKSLTFWILKAEEKVTMKRVLDIEVFGCIRSMESFRPDKEIRDYVMIGLAFGNIVIFRYDKRSNLFEKVFQKEVGSSECWRNTLGQYIAIDPVGRAVMIGALENIKHFYVFSETLCEEGYTLEFSDTTYDASTEQTLIYDIVAVDYDYDDSEPECVLFACLEAKYQVIYPDQGIEVSKQFIAFYELKNVLECESIDCIPLEHLTVRGNRLIPVPGDTGVFVCASNCILYYKIHHPVVRCPIPRRLNEVAKRSMIVVCSTVCRLQDGNFILVQTEQGDIFRITWEMKENVMLEIRLKYFTTVHLASALCFLFPGYLFVASEFGNHFLYDILGIEDEGPEFTSTVCLDRDDTFFFLPVALKNLKLVKELQSLSPIMHLEIKYPNPEDHRIRGHLYIACGRGQSSTLRILQRRYENYNIGSKIFKHISKKFQKTLEYTPRKFISLPESSNIIIIETDHNTYTMKTKDLKKEKIIKEVVKAAEKYNKLFKDKDNLRLDLSNLLWKISGESIPNIYQCESGMWASAIRILDLQVQTESTMTTMTTTQIYKEPFEQNEAAFSLSLVKFKSQKDIQYLLVGVAIKLELGYNFAQYGKIYTYKVVNSTLELVHKTVVDDCPTAMCPFHGCVLIGVGTALRIYDYSEVMLYPKYEIPNLCSRIVSIHSFEEDNHVYVGDVKNGFYYLLYKNDDDKGEETLEIYAEDVNPAWITTACLWGNDTLARADKFGNIFIVRLPSEKPSKESIFPININAILPRKYPAKVEMLGTFHVGEIVCSLEVGNFSSQRNSDVLIYATLSGSIGILAPIEEDEVPLLHFELLMRVIKHDLCFGDHLAFRSSYYPLLNVIDGDFLEQFYLLSDEEQNTIESNIDESPSMMLEKLRLKYLG